MFGQPRAYQAHSIGVQGGGGRNSLCKNYNESIYMFETPLLQRIKAFKISIASKFPFIQLTDFKELLLWKTIPVPVLCIITGLKVETMYSA